MTQANQNQKTSDEYRASIRLRNERGSSEITLISDNEELLQEQIRMLMPDQTKPIVHDAGEKGALLFHPKMFNGTEPCGWVTEYKVPQRLSVIESVRQASGASAASASGH